MADRGCGPGEIDSDQHHPAAPDPELLDQVEGRGRRRSDRYGRAPPPPPARTPHHLPQATPETPETVGGSKGRTQTGDRRRAPSGDRVRDAPGRSICATETGKDDRTCAAGPGRAIANRSRSAPSPEDAGRHPSQDPRLRSDLSSRTKQSGWTARHPRAGRRRARGSTRRVSRRPTQHRSPPAAIIPAMTPPEDGKAPLFPAADYGNPD